MAPLRYGADPQMEGAASDAKHHSCAPRALVWTHTHIRGKYAWVQYECAEINRVQRVI